MQKKFWNNLRRGACQSWVCMMLILTFIVGAGKAVYGAESSVIENLTVTFKTTYGEAGEIPEPEITINANGCSLGDIQFRTDYDRWKPGKKVRVEITVNADEGKVFPVSLTRTQCKITGADFVSARSLDDGRLQVKADYCPVAVLGETEKAGWSSRNQKRAVWTSVENAPGYSLVLYGGDKVIKRMNLETNSVDLSEFMNDEDLTYYYEVKAIPITSDEKKYLKEGEAVSSTAQELEWEEPEQVKDYGDGGAIRGNTYILPDGSKAVNSWKKINDVWYYFDQDGLMTKGWIIVDGFYYYMDQNGIMQTGWVSSDGGVTWYFLNENGNLCTGWIQPEPGVWYYLNAAGVMQRGWVSDNGRWYYMNQDGRMHTGWLDLSGVFYYLYSDGSMATNAMIDGWMISESGIAHP